MTRDRLSRVFERGLGTPVGFVLPVQRWQAASGRRRWLTELVVHAMRSACSCSGRVAGGLPLPLPSLPHLPPTKFPRVIPIDPFEERGALAGPGRTPAAVSERRLDARTRSRARAHDRKPTRPRRRGAGANRARRRTARRSVERVHAAGRDGRGLSGSGRGGGRHRRRADDARASRRLRSAERSASERHQGDARSRCHRGQHSSVARLGRDGRDDERDLRRGAPDTPRHRKIHARRPSHRHRRRQPRRARRTNRAGQPVPAAARSAAQSDHLLAASSGAVVPVLRDVHRPDQSGTARRRSAPRRSARTGTRVHRGAGSGTTARRRPGSSTGSSAIC